MGGEAKVSYKDMYVAYLDILGFKELVGSESCDAIYNIFEEVKETELISPIYFMNDPELNYPLDSVKKYIMSDSIVMYIEAKKKNALNALVKQCSLMANCLLSREQPVLIRGGISRGKFYRKKYIAFGPALVSAYNIENMTKYPRIMIHEDIISEYKADYNNKQFIYIEDNNNYVSYWFAFDKEKKYSIAEKIKNAEKLLKESINKTDKEDEIKKLKSVLEKYEYIVTKLED